MLIPPLPIKNSSLQEKVLLKRKLKFARFLQAVVRSEEFKGSSLILFFLCMPNSDAWQTSSKKEELVKY
jgi:hypothetical protein